AVGASRARDLVQSKHSGVGVDPNVVPHVAVHGAWPVLSALCGVLVVLGALLVVLRGRRWAAMSARYESPVGEKSLTPQAEVDVEAERGRARASLWRGRGRGGGPPGGGG